MTDGGARTLYLDGKVPLRVLRDGPALRVRQQSNADRLYPVRRLLRIVSSGLVDWSMDALMACADAGVQVDFLRGNGTSRACLICRRTAPGVVNLEELIGVLLENQDGLEYYRHWFRAQAQHQRLKLVRLADRGLWPTKPTVLRRLLHERGCYHARGHDLTRFNKQVFGLVSGYISLLLAKAGLGPATPERLVGGIDPSQDFSQVLSWTLENRKLTFLRRQQHSAMRAGGRFANLDFRKAVQFFESSTRFLDTGFDELLREFHLYLVEQAYGHVNQ